MSKPQPKPDEEDRWSDSHAWRAEFRRRMAEKGIIVRLPRTGQEPWTPPALGFTADELSETVIRQRRGEG